MMRPSSMARMARMSFPGSHGRNPNFDKFFVAAIELNEEIYITVIRARVQFS